MKKLFLLTTVTIFALLIPTFSNALVPAQIVNADQFIVNLNAVMLSLAKTSPVPVRFPIKVLADKDHQQYFASSDPYVAQRQAYQINIDYSANCNGAHYCTVGYVRGEKNAKPETQRDRKHKLITKKVELTNNLSGYYTHGHAMGSYFPPTLQWRDQEILYTISWDDHFTSEAGIIEMANSAIANHH